MNQLFSIQDDKVVITKLALRYLEGAIILAGNLDIAGYASVQSDLAVNGTLTADTIKVKTLITEAGNPIDLGNWACNSEDELTGKGFTWTHGSGSTQLLYRTGSRLWTNGNVDLDINRAYHIDNVSVLSSKELGSTVTKSNLKEVGTLKALAVLGPTQLSEFAYFNPNNCRLGIGTDEPNAAISIVENDVEVILGSPRYGSGNVGTYSNHDLAIITDNTPRITVKNNGEVQIGNEGDKAGILRVYGTLYADNVIADTRVERSSPLEFKATRDSSIYGKGLIWSGTGATRQMIMMANPDRLFSSESIEIAPGQSYYADGKIVLTSSTLGYGVVKSNLSSVGILESLTVQGTTTLLGEINAISSALNIGTIVLNDGVKNLAVSNNGINTSVNFSLAVNNSEILYGDNNEIVIGNKLAVRRPIKLFGPVSIGISNPDPTVSLSVSGNISFSNKKFITGIAVPTSGDNIKGDICWNQEPSASGYVGWICISSGTPGEWLPFGAIGRQS